MSVRIKLCGVRRVEDALLCAEAGADEIGVVFAPASRRRVTVEEAKAIRAALPPRIPLVGVFLVGVFQDASMGEALSVAREVGLSAIQLHGELQRPPPLSLPCYAAVQTENEESLARLEELSGFRRVLLDGPRAGSGARFDWVLARRARELIDAELFIAGGLTAENVAQAIREARPDGVDVSSGIEGTDGFKDPERVRAFIRAARVLPALLEGEGPGWS